MSLDVTIKFKEPQFINYNATHAACGSTMMMVDDNYVEETTEWNANVTHNMTTMASHIPTYYLTQQGFKETTLYEVVWRPDELKYNDETNCCNTSYIVDALLEGLRYMINHKDELEQYNPENGWGSYNSFVQWLFYYYDMCKKNPDCEIEVDR